MSRPVKLSDTAQNDLRRLSQFLDALSPRASVRAARVIREAILQLSNFPMLGMAIEDDMRLLRIRFGDSGYVAEYRLDAKVVVIARIFHMREDRP